MSIFIDEQALRTFIADMGIWAPFIFFLLQLLQVLVAPIPGNITTFVGASLFGFWQGLILSFGAVLLGSIICFWVARKIGKIALVKILGNNKFEKFEHFFNKSASKTRITLTLLFLFPFIPDDILCFFAGLLSIKFRHFFLIVLFARPWGLCASALLGWGSFKMPLWIVISSIALMAIVGLLAIRFSEKLEAFVFNVIAKITKHK